MSWLSELTGGIFLPLCCCTGWGSIEEGASRHAFTVANRFSAQWQNLALGLRVSLCVGGWWATKHESERGTSACQVFGLPSVYFGQAYVILLSKRLWCILMNDTLHRTERNVQFSENCKKKKKKTSPHLPYQWLILSGGPYSPTLQWFSVRHTRAQFLPPPSALRSVYTSLSLVQKVHVFYSLKVDIRIFNKTILPCIVKEILANVVWCLNKR